MLTIKCAKCKTKLFKYLKVGKGKVLKSHKSRIKSLYALQMLNEKYFCPCGNEIGTDEGSYIKLNGKSFTYTGTKRN